MKSSERIPGIPLIVAFFTNQKCKELFYNYLEEVLQFFTTESQSRGEKLFPGVLLYVQHTSRLRCLGPHRLFMLCVQTRRLHYDSLRLGVLAVKNNEKIQTMLPLTPLEKTVAGQELIQMGREAGIKESIKTSTNS